MPRASTILILLLLLLQWKRRCWEERRRQLLTKDEMQDTKLRKYLAVSRADLSLRDLDSFALYLERETRPKHQAALFQFRTQCSLLAAHHIDDEDRIDPTTDPGAMAASHVSSSCGIDCSRRMTPLAPSDRRRKPTAISRDSRTPSPRTPRKTASTPSFFARKVSSRKLGLCGMKI